MLWSGIFLTSNLESWELFCLHDLRTCDRHVNPMVEGLETQPLKKQVSDKAWFALGYTREEAEAQTLL